MVEHSTGFIWGIINLLLSAALRNSNTVEVHVTVDSIASQKNPHLSRVTIIGLKKNVLTWASKTKEINIKVFPLNDSYGPAPKHSTADSIVATEETRSSCELINDMRRDNGLQPLEIITVPHIIDFHGEILSSSRIRSGIVDTDGNPWLSEELRGSIVKMVPNLDNELKTPMGRFSKGQKIYQKSQCLALSKIYQKIEPGLVAVGDVTVKTLLDMEIIPDIGLVDGMTKRASLCEEDLVDATLFDEVLNAKNPAGRLTLHY